VTEPPFCAPHHTATKAAIVGGGSGVIRPGAASLAHQGCLFLDEAPEFDRDVLDALRQPLESGEVVIARSGLTARFPARFTLILAANPCPCAKSTSDRSASTCSPLARRRYLARLSGPLLDRVDVKIELLPVGRAELLSDRRLTEPSSVVAARVRQARQRAARRLAGSPWRLNAEIPGSGLRRGEEPRGVDRRCQLPSRCRDVNDASRALTNHVRGCLADRDVRTAHVRAGDPIPIFGSDVECVEAPHSSGVVDEHVDAAEVAERGNGSLGATALTRRAQSVSSGPAQPVSIGLEMEACDARPPQRWSGRGRSRGGVPMVSCMSTFAAMTPKPRR
jgi:hypothetical protein